MISEAQSRESLLKEEVKEHNFLHLEKNKVIKKLEEEVERLKKENEEQGQYLKSMIEINVMNMAWDGNGDQKEGEQWRKDHKAKEGESFPDYFMRHHSLEIQELEQKNKEMEEQLDLAIHGGNVFKNQADELKQVLKNFYEGFVSQFPKPPDYENIEKLLKQ